MIDTGYKPCPFCGKKHIILDSYERKDRVQYKWVAKMLCANCKACTSNGGFDLTKEEAEEKAIKAWNKRAESEVK